MANNTEKNASKQSEVTYRDVITAFNQIPQILGKKDDLKTQEYKTRINYHFKKFARKVLGPAMEKYNDKLEEKQVELCSVDEHDNIIQDDKGVKKFTKENLKKLNEYQRKLYDEKVKLEKYEIPNEFFSSLDEDNQDIFGPFLNVVELKQAQSRE